MQSIKVLNELLKEISSMHCVQETVTSGRRDLLDLCLCVLQINYIDSKLKDELKAFLDGISNPVVINELQQLITSGKFDIDENRKQSSLLAQYKGLLQEFKEQHYHLVRSWVN